MTDEDICKHMGWAPGFIENLGRDDFAARIRSAVDAAETAAREACIKRLEDGAAALHAKQPTDFEKVGAWNDAWNLAEDLEVAARWLRSNIPAMAEKQGKPR